MAYVHLWYVCVRKKALIQIMAQWPWILKLQYSLHNIGGLIPIWNGGFSFNEKKITHPILSRKGYRVLIVWFNGLVQIVYVYIYIFLNAILVLQACVSCIFKHICFPSMPIADLPVISLGQKNYGPFSLLRVCFF